MSPHRQQQPPPPPLCSFVDKATGERCDHPEIWGGYCDGHQMQKRRGGPLRPLRKRGSPGVRLPGMTVSMKAARALESRGPSVYAAAKAVIEEWADGEEKR